MTVRQIVGAINKAKPLKAWSEPSGAANNARDSLKLLQQCPAAACHGPTTQPRTNFAGLQRRREIRAARHMGMRRAQSAPHRGGARQKPGVRCVPPTCRAE